MTLRPVLGALATAALLLSGCQGIHPGTAVEVGGETISGQQVDAGGELLCQVSAEQLEARRQVVPMRVVNQQVVQLLTLRSIAGQLAADYGVEPGAEYERARAGAREQFSGLDEQARDRVVDLTTSQSYVSSVVVALGRRLAADEGRGEVSQQAAGQRGSEVFSQWADDHRIEVAPRYGLTWSEGRLVADEGDTSYPVSDLAKAAAADTPAGNYAADLPASQRCGGP